MESYADAVVGEVGEGLNVEVSRAESFKWAWISKIVVLTAKEAAYNWCGACRQGIITKYLHEINYSFVITSPNSYFSWMSQPLA